MYSSRKIVLRPMGGLCNRLRTIDSFIDICKRNEFALEVLWTSDVTLNSSFNSLFKELALTNIEIKIIECPQGFPEQNLIKIGKRENGEYAINLNQTRNRIKNIVKQFIFSSKLNKEHNSILKELKQLDYDAIITNDELEKIYNSEEKLDLSIRALDIEFFENVAPFLNKTLNKQNIIYINCCYRVEELKSNYEYLKPTNEIQNKIDNITKEFSRNTVGLHVRRTDHKVSKSMSTNDKFKYVVDKEIQQNENVKFYLSTDDPNFKDEFLNSYSSRIITNSVESYDRNNSMAIKDAVIDLFCLAKCQKIYGSHQSSFSQTAADLGNMKEFIV